MSSLAASALSFTDQGITYTAISASEVEVQLGEGLSGEITVPASVVNEGQSYAVVAVGSGAFRSLGDITKIDLPATIRKIGSEAFRECRGLSNFVIPAATADIAPDAFLYCSGLQDFTVVDGNNAFSTYEGILMDKTQSKLLVCPPRKMETVTLPATVADVAEYAFSSCLFIKEFRLSGESTTASIDDGVLYNLDKTVLMAFPRGKFIYEAVRIPEGVKTILPRACEMVMMLYELILPESMTEVSDYAFPNCAALSIIAFPSKLERIGKSAFETTSVKTMTLPASLKEIDDAAFRYCRSLTSLTIPDAVERIGDEAFSQDSSLESVALGNSLKEIGKSAFYYCSEIKSLEVPASLARVAEGTFSYCTGVTELTLHEGLKEIGKEAFTNLIALKSVNLPSTLTTIGVSGFAACSAIEQLVLPNSVSSVDSMAFTQCIALKSAVLSEGMDSTPYGMFTHCSALQSVSIPSSIKVLGESTFANCTSLEAIELPEGTVEIGGCAFTGCQNLYEVTLSSTVEKIGPQAFNYCDALINVYNRALTPQTIGNDVFSVYRKLHVVEECVEAYKAAPVWQNFNIVGDLSGVKEITEDSSRPAVSYNIAGKRVSGSHKSIRIDIYPDGRRVKTIGR